jgi:hypothetical protein
LWEWVLVRRIIWCIRRQEVWVLGRRWWVVWWGIVWWRCGVLMVVEVGVGGGIGGLVDTVRGYRR